MNPEQMRMINLWLDAVPTNNEDLPNVSAITATSFAINLETMTVDADDLVLSGLSVIHVLLRHAAARLGIEPEELLFDVRQVFAGD